jgi:hypothetical protein
MLQSAKNTNGSFGDLPEEPSVCLGRACRGQQPTALQHFPCQSPKVKSRVFLPVRGRCKSGLALGQRPWGRKVAAAG